VRAKHDLPALAAAVWRGNELAGQGAVGVRKLGDATRVTLGDPWHLGSDTKAMTATLIGLYVDRGKIHFEDTIATIFAGESIDPGYRNVTIEQLLQHRGGAPATVPSDIAARMWEDGSAPDARIRAVRSVLSRAPAQAPGTFAYANMGYIIAGAALERIVGRTWEQIVRDDLFAPLGMGACGFGAPGAAGAISAPWGHTARGTELTPRAPGPKADNPPAYGPAGRVHCPLADWGTFLALHLAGARGESTRLSKATMTRLHTPPPGGDYIAGWMVGTRPWAGGTTLSHTGSNTLWYVVTWLAPSKNLAFAVATNRGGEDAFDGIDSALDPLIQKYAP